MSEAIHRLMVSEELFAIAAQAVCAHSRQTRRFESLHTTVCRACELIRQTPALARSIDPLLCRQGIDGPVRVHLIIKDNWSAMFKEALAELGAAAGRTLSVKEGLCILLNLANRELTAKRGIMALPIDA